MSRETVPVFDLGDIKASGWLLLDASEGDDLPPGSGAVLEITCKCGCPHSITFRPGSSIVMRKPTPDGADVDILNVTWNGRWEPGDGPPGAEEGALR